MDKNQIEFIKFLITAKQNTYAGNGEKSNFSRPNSVDLHYKEGDLMYIDTYLGSFDFIGEEAVWHKDKAVWGMNYYGRMLVGEVPEGFIDCLKGALREVTMEAPFRGPKEYKLGDYVYKCNWSGDISCFDGNEIVLYNDKKIYSLKFHGGFLR